MKAKRIDQPAATIQLVREMYHRRDMVPGTISRNLNIPLEMVKEILWPSSPYGVIGSDD